MGFVVDKVALEQIFLQVLLFSPVNVIRTDVHLLPNVGNLSR
jgi:hypothetical protein